MVRAQPALESMRIIARYDFGITMNMALETGGVFVSEVVKIEISAQAHQLSV